MEDIHQNLHHRARDSDSHHDDHGAQTLGVTCEGSERATATRGGGGGGDMVNVQWLVRRLKVLRAGHQSGNCRHYPHPGF